MNDEDAVNLVLTKMSLSDTQEFKIHKSREFPQYKYVDVIDKETQQSIGGSAYVIAIEDNNRIFAVPNEMPPHFNLRSVSQGDARELTSEG